MLTNKSSTMQQYRAYCDILWFDRYPIAATSIEKSSLKPIAEALDTAMKAGPVSEKPVWPVLQAQDNKGSPTLRKKRPDLQRPDDRTHRPNEAECGPRPTSPSRGERRRSPTTGRPNPGTR